MNQILENVFAYFINTLYIILNNWYTFHSFRIHGKVTFLPSGFFEIDKQSVKAVDYLLRSPFLKRIQISCYQMLVCVFVCKHRKVKER